MIFQPAQLEVTEKKPRSNVLPMPRPKDVKTIDMKIRQINCTADKITVCFSECIDLSEFCRHYHLKISDITSELIYTYPLIRINVFVENKIIDKGRRCFGSELEVILPFRALEPGRYIFLYTMVRGLTHGSEFVCTSLEGEK